MQKFKLLPPTREVCEPNVLCGHFERCIWMTCLQPEPPKMDLLQLFLIILKY